MEPIDDVALNKLIAHGRSQRAIADELHLSRTTLQRHLAKRKGVPEGTSGTPILILESTSPDTTGVPPSEPFGVQEVHQQFSFADELMQSWGDVQEIVAWWRTRKQSLALALDETRKRRRQTYHVEERFIEAIKRAADLERTDLADIVNRAFERYFAEHRRTT